MPAPALQTGALFAAKALVFKPLTLRVGLSAAMAMAAGPAWSLGQSTLANGAAFVSACAGLGFSYIGPAGNAINGGVSDTQAGCQANTSAVGGLVSATATQAGTKFGNPYAGSASGSAGQKFIKLDSATSGSSATGFSGGQVQGGWNERMTITSPGKSGADLWMLPILVTGQLNASQLGARGVVALEVYMNRYSILPYGDALHAQALQTFQTLNTTHNGSIGSGWSNEQIEWGVADYGPGNPLTVTSLNVNTTVWFAVPMVYGQAFDLGVFALASTGQLAAGGQQVANTSGVSFGHTFAWGGKGYLLSGNQHVPNFSLSAATGLNYDQAYASPVPEPTTLAMALAGLGWLGLRRRAQQPGLR